MVKTDKVSKTDSRDINLGSFSSLNRQTHEYNVEKVEGINKEIKEERYLYAGLPLIGSTVVPAGGVAGYMEMASSHPMTATAFGVVSGLTAIYSGQLAYRALKGDFDKNTITSRRIASNLRKPGERGSWISYEHSKLEKAHKRTAYKDSSKNSNPKGIEELVSKDLE